MIGNTLHRVSNMTIDTSSFVLVMTLDTLGLIWASRMNHLYTGGQMPICLCAVGIEEVQIWSSLGILRRYNSYT